MAPNACTGQQRDCQFRRHTHVDGDAITFFDALGFEYVGITLDLRMQLAVGQSCGDFAGFTFPHERDFIA